MERVGKRFAAEGLAMKRLAGGKKQGSYHLLIVHHIDCRPAPTHLGARAGPPFHPKSVAYAWPRLGNDDDARSASEPVLRAAFQRSTPMPDHAGLG